ncbi:MAG: hypothetical protein RIM23_20165 [Coleofasciculus sp. G3-WIS-01]|uniref:hypothetical protein n=1 Tax=Coleofasciculus sp. G3-WIS-01 TaxID=3069528 RepID=UPI0032F80BB4
MDYWEFLLQKEGDRTWLPIKSPKLDLEVGRYRVVAHSSCANTDVEICVTHTDTNETPPKRRYQKRSRRTNPDGLMVIIPFTYLKPGLWELRCCGDIMSDFLGNSWQEMVQLSVAPKAREVLNRAEGRDFKEGCKEQENNITRETVNSESTHPEELHPPLMASLHSQQTQEVHPTQQESPIADNSSSDSSHPIAQPAPSPSPTELPTLAQIVALPQTSNPFPFPLSNPILDQSLQVLEQVLQQVLDPVIKEFEESESSELPIPITTESEFPSEEDTQDTPWQGLILTLEEEALVAQRGESLTVAGQVDRLNIHQLHQRSTVQSETHQFQGILHYELRHPQTGQVVVDVQTPITTPTFPVAFSQSLDIPSDSKTCLLLGKVNLYRSTGTALASQPFTVTVDLDELLVAVQSGSWMKSEDTTPVVSILNPKSQSTPLNQTFLELINNPPSRQPFIYKPSANQPLPPQLYQPQSQPGLTKSLELPTFSQPKLTTARASESLEKIEPETEARSPSVEPAEKQTTETTPSAPDDTTEDFVIDSSVTESPVQETTDGETNKDIPIPSKAFSEASVQTETVTDASEPSKPETQPLEDNPAALAETSEEAAIESTEISDVWTSTPDPEPSSFQKEEISNPELSEWKTAAMSSAAAINQDPLAVDHAFTQLNLDDRFWGRLNALMTDTDLAEWLKIELPSRENLVELEGGLSEPEVDPLFAQPEEIPPSSEEDTPLNDFDESMWDEDTEEVGSLSHENIPKLEPPVQPDPPPLNREELLEREIVVDEDEPQASEPSESQPIGSRTIETQRSHLRTADMAQLDLETPLLPTPELFIPTQELAAGEPVLVRVKVTPDSARLGVKLWVQDRQSRSLLDGPRWLMDLSPNKAGELEALTQLVVPFGTVEIRFEAITVDLDSERESHKVTVDRVVVPPNLSDFSDDEL